MMGGSAGVEIKILNSATNNEIWAGRSGTIASFHLEKPTEVIFNSPAGRPFKTKLLVTTIDPQKGKTYELSYLESAFGFPKYMLNVIDMLT